LFADRRGVVALIFGLSAIPVIGLVGLAVDYGFAAQAKAQLALVADTATMQAVTTAAAVYRSEAAANNPNALSDALAKAAAAGQSWFSIQSGTVLNATVTGPVIPTVRPQYGQLNNGALSGFTATVTYTANVSTYFGGMFGVSTIAESGTSEAVVNENNFVNVTFLLDNSSSMNLVANQSDVTTLQNAVANYNTNHFAAGVVGNGLVPVITGGVANEVRQSDPLPCAFACHWTTTAGTAADGNAGFTDDYYGIARAKGIQVRFDLVQSAVASAVQTMIANEQIAGQYGIGVFEFNAPLQCTPVVQGPAPLPVCPQPGPSDTALYEVYPNATNSPVAGQIAGTDLNAALTAAQGIVTPVSVDYANTLFGGSNGAMQKLTALIPQAGSGATASSPQQAMIIITDGIEDFLPQQPDPPPLGVYGGRQIPGQEDTPGVGVERPFLSSDCAYAKAKNINVFVIYTTYFDNASLLPFGNYLLAPYLTGTDSVDVVPELTACASSPQNFIQASDAAAIGSAVQQFLLAALRGSGRFSQ
jgi:Flp pilus assembly protein TadG